MSSSNSSTSNLTPSMSKLPEIFIRHICSIREASMDTAHNTPMIDSDFKVVNFDEVKKEYRSTLKSNDALFVDSKYRIFFIEFKNGVIRDENNVELYEKIYDSVNILSDICCKENVDRICCNVISYLKKHCEYILVYNEEKINPDSPTERTESGLKRQNCSSECLRNIKKHLAAKAKKEVVLFGLDFFRGYLFYNIHTYTVENFRQNMLTKWESKVLKES